MLIKRMASQRPAHYAGTSPSRTCRLPTTRRPSCMSQESMLTQRTSSLAIVTCTPSVSVCSSTKPLTARHANRVDARDIPDLGRDVAGAAGYRLSAARGRRRDESVLALAIRVAQRTGLSLRARPREEAACDRRSAPARETVPIQLALSSSSSPCEFHRVASVPTTSY